MPTMIAGPDIGGPIDDRRCDQHLADDPGDHHVDDDQHDHHQHDTVDGDPDDHRSGDRRGLRAAIEYCDAAEPLPVGAVLHSSLTLDIMGDGTADDLIEAWAVDRWSRLRLTTGANVVSEVVSSAVDGRYRPLGVASVLPGDSDELFAVVVEGSAATEIGVFGIDAADCLFSYTYSGLSDDFTMLIRPLSSVRSGALCFAGGIDLFSAEQRPDGTWDASSAAYEVAGPWTMEYRGRYRRLRRTTRGVGAPPVRVRLLRAVVVASSTIVDDACVSSERRGSPRPDRREGVPEPLRIHQERAGHVGAVDRERLVAEIGDVEQLIVLTALVEGASSVPTCVMKVSLSPAAPARSGTLRRRWHRRARSCPGSRTRRCSRSRRSASRTCRSFRRPASVWRIRRPTPLRRLLRRRTPPQRCPR